MASRYKTGWRWTIGDLVGWKSSRRQYTERIFAKQMTTHSDCVAHDVYTYNIIQMDQENTRVAQWPVRQSTEEERTVD